MTVRGKVLVDLMSLASVGEGRKEGRANTLVLGYRIIILYEYTVIYSGMKVNDGMDRGLRCQSFLLFLALYLPN